MKRPSFKSVVVALLISLTTIGVLAHFVYRPWQTSWGATDEEVDRRMPGDEIIGNPTFVATRAVTIHADPARIWAWIVQIGYKKAGFYSWDFLDNAGIPSATQIIPEYQDLRVGDRIPLGDEDGAVVSALEANEYLVLVFEPDSLGTWAWGLYQDQPGITRMVTRLRVRTSNLFSRFMLEYLEIIMMRKHMLGIKERAEAKS